MQQNQNNGSADGLYIALISIHGLIRGRDLELGRDADTGGQTKYVVDLANALVRQPGVARVDLITRRVIDERLDSSYSEEQEPLEAPGAQIIRIDCGPRQYIAKEKLWEHLDTFSDNLLRFFQQQQRMPDLLHSHYADAGYVATQISHVLGMPLVHTGHSLGRDKRKRLMASGMPSSEVEQKYNMQRRIEAEEQVLANANLVITSTRQEIESQYELYDYYCPESMRVIPPGTDLSQFHPPQLGEAQTQIASAIRRFLDEPDKPMILALSRPDPRKNIATLVRAYGESPELRTMANLVIVAGNRDDIREMNDGAQEVLTELLVLLDYYDLYGKLALPKKHLPSEVPAIYRMAARSCGIFINPALTEPFGLTLLESAATGLPFIATENGGPQDIVENCETGILVDPLSANDLGKTMKTLLLDGELWRKFSANGIKNVALKYSWDAHARSYLKQIKPLVEAHKPQQFSPAILRASRFADRLIVSDLDKTLLSNPTGLREFCQMLRERRKQVAFGIATARRLDSVLKLLKKYRIPKPDILISSLGSQIHYGRELEVSTDWESHVDHDWNPRAIRRILRDVPGLTLQEDSEQSKFKISFHIDPSEQGILTKEKIVSLLRQEEQSVNVFVSAGQNLDITPARVSKGLALRYVAQIWGIPLERVLVAAGAGTDEDMITGNTLSVVVHNRQHETLENQQEGHNVFFATQPNALGILEAIEHYHFFDEIPGVEVAAPDA
ncbi:HAD-IIB family hydrolase [Shewanella fodinae]|uniref:HAD-IIB family hydrolase n=1 Tax=Shewanella fodinae TaxID=552357 RepID=UPI00167C0BC2|nr:HAD-IIB family hydrolase [Shewanella fodinae]MCL2906876.1 HAD-IIB family hydrolase [Shewanella fodinae]GGZ04196.1 sucrose-phosphate synthase [Shewanella fodinae]